MQISHGTNLNVLFVIRIRLRHFSIEVGGAAPVSVHFPS